MDLENTPMLYQLPKRQRSISSNPKFHKTIITSNFYHVQIKQIN
jgi:hypothetical protein